MVLPRTRYEPNEVGSEVARERHGLKELLDFLKAWYPASERQDCTSANRWRARITTAAVLDLLDQRRLKGRGLPSVLLLFPGNAAVPDEPDGSKGEREGTAGDKAVC